MKVLVVVDMQNDFITGPLGTPEAQAIVPKVCELIRSVENGMSIPMDGDEIYYTMDTHDAFYLDSHEGKMLPIEHCIYKTDGWHICDEVDMALSEKIREYFVVDEIIKEGFGSTSLAQRLREGANYKRIERIDICGVCTDICVISNALMLRSLIPEVNIRVIASACAGTTPEMHQKALDVMRSCQIEVVE